MVELRPQLVDSPGRGDSLDCQSGPQKIDCLPGSSARSTPGCLEEMTRIDGHIVQVFNAQYFHETHLEITAVYLLYVCHCTHPSSPADTRGASSGSIWILQLDEALGHRLPFKSKHCMCISD